MEMLGKKRGFALALALGICAGSAHAVTAVFMSGTAPKTLGGMEGVQTRLHVPLQRVLAIGDGTPAGDVFSAAANGNAITLTLNTGANWTNLATTQFNVANVQFLNASGTTCGIDFSTPALI